MLITLVFNVVGFFADPPLPGGVLMSAAGRAAVSLRRPARVGLSRRKQLDQCLRRSSGSIACSRACASSRSCSSTWCATASQRFGWISSRTSRRARPSSAGILGGLGRHIADHAGDCGVSRVPVGVAAADLPRGVRAEELVHRRSSRSTSRTSPACPRSSTACWRWVCSSTSSALGQSIAVRRPDARAADPADRHRRDARSDPRRARRRSARRPTGSARRAGKSRKDHVLPYSHRRHPRRA